MHPDVHLSITKHQNYRKIAMRQYKSIHYCLTWSMNFASRASFWLVFGIFLFYHIYSKELFFVYCSVQDLPILTEVLESLPPNNIERHFASFIYHTSYIADIILQRLQQVAEFIYPQSQSGYRHERSTIDRIFTLRQLMEKTREQRRSLYIAFVDFTKAFDTVDSWGTSRGVFKGTG